MVLEDRLSLYFFGCGYNLFLFFSLYESNTELKLFR